MNIKFSILAVALSLLVFLSACKKDDNVDPSAKFGSNYIINYGSYSGDKGGISLFNMVDSSVTNDYYKSVNGVTTVSNIQYAYNTNGNIYFMGNNADQVFYVDEKTFKQTSNSIPDDDGLIVKPRHCVAQGDVLYVSCWGGDVYLDNSLGYITKIDLNTNSITDTINIPGGPEGLAIANGKLYVALNYVNKIAVMDLNTEAISYISTTAVPSFFLKDNEENLYVSLVSTYSNPSTETGLGYINTSTDELKLYGLADISASSYDNITRFNQDKTKIYVMTSSYDANWNLTGSIVTFDVANSSFDSEALVKGINSINGITTHSQNSDLFYFVSESTTANGKMVQITEDGTVVKEYETGISPFMMLTVN